jgi:hypothetical protein
MPNALLVYPEFPPSYWGAKFALDFVGKKSNTPELGLLTIAGMFPRNYRLKVVDMNVAPLTDADLDWADVVLTSTMIVQKDSLQQVIESCNRAQIPIVAGGPHPTFASMEPRRNCGPGTGVSATLNSWTEKERSGKIERGRSQKLNVTVWAIISLDDKFLRLQAPKSTETAANLNL